MTPPSGDEPTPRPGRTDGRPRGRAQSAAEAARLARIFGDTLPQTTSDERGADGERAPSGDEWLRSQVPPHHT